MRVKNGWWFVVFMGEFLHTIDNKGRLILPAKFREDLGDTFVITKGLDNCLFIYSKPEWGIIEEKVKKLPLAKPEARAFVRFFFSGAAEVECDKQGRVLVPNNLREFGGLDKDVVVIGVSSRIELWDKETWENYNSVIAPSVAQMAEDLTDLGI